MILAKIGNETFKLETIAEAEAVLKIFSKAPRLDWNFDGYSRSYYTEKNGKNIELSITHETIVSAEEHAAIQAARKQQLAGA